MKIETKSRQAGTLTNNPHPHTHTHTLTSSTFIPFCLLLCYIATSLQSFDLSITPCLMCVSFCSQGDRISWMKFSKVIRQAKSLSMEMRRHSESLNLWVNQADRMGVFNLNISFICKNLQSELIWWYWSQFKSLHVIPGAGWNNGACEPELYRETCQLLVWSSSEADLVSGVKNKIK